MVSLYRFRFVCSMYCIGLDSFDLWGAGIGVLRSLLPVSLFEHLFDGPSSPPTDAEDHALCAVRSLTSTLAVSLPHVCHRLEMGALSVASHMQEDVDIPEAPRRLSAPFPLLETVTSTSKLAVVSPTTWLSAGTF